MADASRESGCGFCGKDLVQRSGGGHPRDYCDDACRRRAQRKRDRERRAAVPQFSHRFIAAELEIWAGELLTACFSDAALDEVLDLAARVGDEAECVAAAAVGEARAAGRSWSDIAAPARTSEGSARARWGGARVARRLAARAPMPGARQPGGAPPAVSPTATRSAAHARRAAAALARALRTLQERSDLPLDTVAAHADMPTPAVLWVLEGQLVAPWPVTYTLAHLLGGQPQDLRLLWETASKPVTPGLDSGNSEDRLAAGMRGARLAAGSPSTAAVCPLGLNEAEAEAVFDGRLVPEWSVLRDMLARLDAAPEPFEELWASCLATREERRPE
ncbi:hypothetical protein ACIOHE_23680 [Streptomyces sp. NPDC087851]|uniref:hypothetical protein n=1 Tax=Streptomyces sp. NPDC087851 TaxID=3365810 RepID=UPI0037FF1E2A